VITNVKQVTISNDVVTKVMNVGSGGRLLPELRRATTSRDVITNVKQATISNDVVTKVMNVDVM